MISIALSHSCLSPTHDLANPWAELGSASLYISRQESKGTEFQVASSRLSGEPRRGTGRGRLLFLVSGAHLGLVDTRKQPQGLRGPSSAEIT